MQITTDTLFIGAQVAAGLSIVTGIWGFQMRDRTAILWMFCLTSVLWTLHYLLMQEPVAAMILVVVSLRYLASIWLPSRMTLVVFLALSTGLALPFWAGAVSLLPLTGNVCNTVASFQVGSRLMRGWFLVGAVLYLTYNVLIGSPIGSLAMLTSMVSNVIGFFRFERR